MNRVDASHAREVVLITGSTGLIGSALSSALRSSMTVVGFDLHPGKDEGANHERIQVDLTSDESVRSGLDELRARFGGALVGVVHLAAFYDFSGEPNELYDELTVEGTRRLLDGLATFDHVGRFVFASSMLVYEPTEPGEPITDDSAVSARWAYPASKLAAEDVIREHPAGISHAILRIAGVYDDVGHSLPLAHQIQRLFERRLVGHAFPGDADRGQSYLHIGDLIDAIARLLDPQHPMPPALTMVLGEEVTLSYEDLQDRISHELFGEDWTTLEVPPELAKLGAWLKERVTGQEDFIRPAMIDWADEHYEVRCRAAREYLGWEPRHSLAETLPRILERLKADPEGWYREHGLE